ncbi:hypothetical protein [Planomonospora venezuelensis]|uniref:Uncharacterized protein n=1 Tax=Planomonospora venezuelensis TaxID=1999 RepID=A0A841D6I1_PLAVE|nr:hypothetical protein [Planomonospora venezuelensis]MBB5965089.1 hypothetical protein [Planomonospora venezuelensis]GIN04993.1 hypothetical protein Pve01_66510 [Planomonospora venezuelensis]
MATPEERSRAARIAANVQWATTANRAERTEAARRRSPVSLDYWIDRIRAEGIVREQDVVKAATNAHKAYMAQMSLKAAKARSRRAAEKKPSRKAA